LHWDFNSGTKGLKKRSSRLWPGSMWLMIEATCGLVNMWGILLTI
jgi:hypothetical protein